MAWAVKQPTANSGQKLVLLLLANHTNGHTGQCNPSHKLLAQECSMGISTLKGHLQGLAEAGLISIIHKQQDGVALPNQYRLNLGGVGQNLTEGQSEIDRGVGQNLATKQEVKTVNKPVEQDVPFQTFWKAYPRKVGIAAAKKSFAKLNVDEVLLKKMLTAINQQKMTAWKDKDQQYIPHPSTWLNGERWEDEITFTAELSPLQKALRGAL